MLYFFLIHSMSRLLLELLTNDFRIVASSFLRVNFLKTPNSSWKLRPSECRYRCWAPTPRWRSNKGRSWCQCYKTLFLRHMHCG